MTTPHRKLKKDGIVEVLVEIRFETNELSELVLGKLLSAKLIDDNAIVSRLPAADLPEPIRKSDPNLKYQPHIEKRDKNNRATLRVGSNVVSFHIYKYPGWDVYKQHISQLVEHLCTEVDSVTIKKLSLRYVDLLNPNDHKITDINALTMDLSVNKESLENINLSYLKSFDEQDETAHTVITKIASPIFVQGGRVPEKTAAIIDIDLFTPGNYSETNSDKIMRWYEAAHKTGNDIFFGLIPPEILQDITQD